MKYRAEVDGLRTVAVLPVILYHAGVPGLEAGFLGVDIFFVISGFLITTILVSDLERDRYSILTFYERRARRILPALFVVIFACLPFAWTWMFADGLRDFGQSVVATAFFVSNFLFWQESGYFAFGTDLKPLMHTWSLAIEEQYYILFPPMLALAWKFGRKVVFLLVLMIAVGSLALAQFWSHSNPDANFFLLPSRAWELMAGALAAFWMLWRRPAAQNTLAWIGLALLAAGFVFFDNSTPHPSLLTLLPVIGTALVLLFARDGTGVARLLSLRPMVAIGLISYSAYLWHQPLFAFARLRSITEPELGLMLALAALSLVLAALSWKFVETPFRTSAQTLPRLLPKRSAMLGGATAAIVAVAALGALLHQIDGAPERVPAYVTALKAANKDINPNRKYCLWTAETATAYQLPPNPACVTQSNLGGSHAVIIGDSHADAISSPIRDELEHRGWRVTQLTASDCEPALGVQKGAKDCNLIMERNLAYLETHPADLVIASGRLQNLFGDGFFDNGEGGREYRYRRPLISISSAEIGAPAQLEAETLAAAALKAGIYRLLEFSPRIVFVHPIPEAGWHVPEMAAKMAFLEQNPTPTITTDRTAYDSRAEAAIAALETIDDPRLFHIRPVEIFCNSSRCMNADRGEIYYHDDDHLSLTGARLVAEAIIDRLPQILAPQAEKWERNHPAADSRRDSAYETLGH